MTETMANGYSFERTQRDLSNEYQLDRVSMVFKKVLVPQHSKGQGHTQTCIKLTLCRKLSPYLYKADANSSTTSRTISMTST